MKKKDLDRIWSSVQDHVKNETTLVSAAYQAWIAPVKAVNIDQENRVLYLSTEIEMGKSLLESRYKQTLESSVAAILGEPYKVVVMLADEIDGTQEETFYTPYTDELNLNPKYIFSTFVVGKNNEFAHAVSLAVANNPSRAHNPLFLYGDAGLGKTHLMHAIGHAIRKNFPNLKVLYVSSEMFTNELIRAIRENRQMEFKNKYRSIDVFMLDDIQFIEGKDSTQEELFYTFNDLHMANKQIIFTSDKPPSQLKGLEQRLTSRFGMGMVAKIEEPDYETRVAILTKKAELEDIYLSDTAMEAIHTIAQNIPSNIRELEGALNRIIAYANLTNQKITKEMAHQVLQDVFSSKQKEVTPEEIKKTVAKHFNVKLADFDSSKRSRNIAYPRQIAMYLCREMTGLSLPKIGELFGGRDHTTVLHGCEKISKDLESEPDSELHQTIEALKNEMQES
ncbi:MAG: chromosomal replication initiator protein DnaA [Firmicutes bacterium]|nr:chromosomal replication initiator protein DnaA [Bacillota bacterium]